jgi:hypothetical protein
MNRIAIYTPALIDEMAAGRKGLPLSFQTKRTMFVIGTSLHSPRRTI